MRTLYVHAHPSREQYADGYAGALNQYCSEDDDDGDDVRYVVVVNALCPPGKLLILDSPDYTGAGA